MKTASLFFILFSCLIVNSQVFNPDSLLGKSYIEIDTSFVVATAEKPTISSYPEFHSEYLCYKKLGFELLFEKNILTAIFIYLQPKDGYAVYENGFLIPLESNKFKNRKEVIKKMGEPFKTNEKASGFYWDKYNLGKSLLHFEYDKNEDIKMITIMLNDDFVSE
jgi:hypothetical protein